MVLRLFALVIVVLLSRPGLGQARVASAPPDVRAGARIITTDTLVVEQLDVQEPEIENAWKAALDAGLLQLPGRVNRSSPTLGDATYVIELRRGDEYRAAEIERLDHAEVEADTQVSRVYAAVGRLLPRR